MKKCWSVDGGRAFALYFRPHPVTKVKLRYMPLITEIEWTNQNARNALSEAENLINCGIHRNVVVF